MVLSTVRRIRRKKKGLYFMKLFSKATALVLTLCIVLSLSACHPKDESAFSLGDIKLTSAMYSACILQAVDEAAEKISEDGTEISSLEDCYDKTVDNLSFEEWVTKTAKKYAYRFIFLDKLEQDKTISLTEDQESEVESYVNSQWSQMSSYYELNGVSQATYTKLIRYSYLQEQYFKSIYGEKGTKAVSTDEQDKYYKENFLLVHMISDNYTNTETGAAYTDDEKAAAKSKFENYEKELKSGKRKFAEIYKEFYNITDDIDKSLQNENIKDVYAQVIGSKNTGENYKDDNFAAVQAMKVGEIKIIESDNNIVLYERLDINSDSYYKTELASSILHLLKDDEFETALDEEAAKLDIKENTYATGVFTPKGVKTPEQ